MRKIPETIVEVEQPRYKGKLVTMYNLKRKKRDTSHFCLLIIKLKPAGCISMNLL
jgi:hypothetical protein